MSCKTSPLWAKPNAKDPLEKTRPSSWGSSALGNYLTQAKGGPPEGIINRAERRRRFKIDNLNSNLYFLWSLERVAVIYGLETIGNHDWYTWGSDALVDSQQAGGSWGGGGYHGANDEINTSFALLFLSRANVARDLTAALKGKVKDPGVSVLRGGGDIARELPDRVAPKTEPMPAPTSDGVRSRSRQISRFRHQRDCRSADRLFWPTARQQRECQHRGPSSRGEPTHGQCSQQTREALSKRLKRMTAATLRTMLKDDNREIRLAAATASF